MIGNSHYLFGVKMPITGDYKTGFNDAIRAMKEIIKESEKESLKFEETERGKAFLDCYEMIRENFDCLLMEEIKIKQPGKVLITLCYEGHYHDVVEGSKTGKSISYIEFLEQIGEEGRACLIDILESNYGQ